MFSKKRILLYFFFFIFLNYVLSSLYRPYIYENKINDIGLADVGNNILFVPGVYFLTLLVRGKPLYGYYKDIFLHFTLLTIFEILSYFVGGIGTYDFKDILGLLFGSVICFVIVLLHKNDVCH